MFGFSRGAVLKCGFMLSLMVQYTELGYTKKKYVTRSIYKYCTFEIKKIYVYSLHFGIVCHRPARVCCTLG